MESYLTGKSVTIAYNPDDICHVWLLDSGAFISFELIESRLEGLSLIEAEEMHRVQNTMVKEARTDRVQAEIDLIGHILTIAGQAQPDTAVKLKDIRETRQKETQRNHKDFIREETGLHE